MIVKIGCISEGFSTRALALNLKKMKQAESFLYDSVRPHEPKNPKTLKKYDEAFFLQPKFKMAAPRIY